MNDRTDRQNLMDICAIMRANGSAERAIDFQPVSYTTSESAIARPAGDPGIVALENGSEGVQAGLSILLVSSCALVLVFVSL